MFTRIFPRAFDNDYRGYRVAIWLFVPLVLIRLLMGVNFIWHPENVAVTADAIPLASYSRAAAAAVVSLYAQIGLYRLLLALLTALALLRYRGMIPLLYLLLLAELLGSRLLDGLYPIAKSGVASAMAGSALILAMLGLAAGGLLLSLLPIDSAPRADGRFPREV
jgi:hypothetical protein